MDNKCAVWGSLDEWERDHMDCPVVVTTLDDLVLGSDADRNITLPHVCKCECRTCKRAWEAQGRPSVKDGVVVRRV